jgi:exodeoxyribonuclease V alpha subunit
MITVNDYNLNLYNGDIGVVLEEPPEGPRVWLPAPDGALRRISPSRLPAHETVYAMSVHKSQGSEFDQVLLILPDRDSPVLTRELIYTALTRARDKVTVWGTRPVFLKAAARHIRRTTGLREQLWGDGKNT